MLAINLTGWGGTEFCYAPGALIDLPEATALARIDAGLMREPTADELTQPAFLFPGYVPPTPQPPEPPRQPRAKGKSNAVS